MIIHEVQLTNIGPYRGIGNSFDFHTDTEKHRNVILIGGENGAGKTTLLNAIKLGMFGSYGFGYKTENADYFKRVQYILNQDAKRTNENNFRIKLSFSLVDNFEKTDYVMYRSWKFNNHNIKEYLEIVADGKHFSEYEKEIFQSKLKEIMPPQLLDLCLFDGEEISRIVNEDLLPEYLRKLSSIVFNLDLFETLENDLENYTSKELDRINIDSVAKEYHSLNKRKKEIKKLIWDKKLQLEELIADKTKIEGEYHYLKKQFEKHGGLVKSQRDKINQEINTIEALRKQNMEKIKDFISNLLPFYLTRNLLNQTREQIKEEESIQLHKQLDSILTDGKIKDLLHSIDGSLNPDISNKLRSGILDLLKPRDNIIQIHEASFSESSLIENMHLIVSGERDKDTIQLIQENRDKLIELQDLKQKLKINDSTSEFNDLILQMETKQQEIPKLEVQIIQTKDELKEIQQELNIINNKLDKKQSTLIDSEKNTNSFHEAQKIIAMSRRFREIQLQKKLQQVQIETTSMLKKIIRKHNYISSIIIDHKSYEIKLFDSHKQPIERTTLSAGEKEILLISIIWAIFKVSGRKVPFIFDTLLGRLDKTHKAAILREFIPTCSEQVIILSTDTEIDKENYQILEPCISMEYMLDFKVETQETTIRDHYFIPLENWS